MCHNHTQFQHTIQKRRVSVHSPLFYGFIYKLFSFVLITSSPLFLVSYDNKSRRKNSYSIRALLSYHIPLNFTTSFFTYFSTYCNIPTLLACYYYTMVYLHHGITFSVHMFSDIHTTSRAVLISMRYIIIIILVNS